MMQRCKRVKTVLLSAILVLGLSACASSQQNDTLYRALGELDGITRIADNFLFYLSKDDRVVEFFAETDIDRFHQKVIEHICELTGGPCEYTGDAMVTTHEGMNINETQFNAVVEDLIRAMQDERVPTRAQNELLAVLAGLHGEITHR